MFRRFNAWSLVLDTYFAHQNSSIRMHNAQIISNCLDNVLINGNLTLTISIFIVVAHILTITGTIPVGLS